MQVSALERFAFGRPVTDTEHIQVAERSGTMLVGRILLATIFVASGLNMLAHVDATAGHMASAGVPAAHPLAIVAGLAQVLGGLAVVFGFLTRVAAIGLILFLIPTTLIFHHFWNLTGAEQQQQLVNFLKNLGIIGGLALLFAHGAGAYSIDRRLRRQA
jgi:putative oxidoreductase